MQTLDAMRQRASGAAAAAPELALAATCLAGLFAEKIAARILPSIVEAVGAECIAILTFPFLAKVAFAKAASRWTPVWRLITFVGLAAFLSWRLSLFGARAVALFWTLTVTTFFGFLVHDAPESRQTLLVYRWIVSLVTLIGVIGVTAAAIHLFRLEGPRRGALIGFLLFSILGAMDWTNFYDRLLRRRGSQTRSSIEFDTRPGDVLNLKSAFALVLFGLVWTAFASLILYVLVTARSASPAWWLLALFPLLGVAILLSGMIAVVRAMRQRWSQMRRAG